MDYKSLIHRLNTAVTSHIENKKLLHLLLSFIEAKKTFPFAQLTNLHYTAFGGKEDEVVHLSGAVELLALSFDILDDLEDLDNFEEPWMKIDSSVALNAATALYTVSLKMADELHSPYKGMIISAFHRLALQAMEGQHADLENRIETEEECTSMIEKKSGSLVALASVSGAMLATGEEQAIVEKYSYQIGLAAQIENDYRDLFHLHKNDLSSQKKSLALLYINREFNEHSKELSRFIAEGKSYEEQYGDAAAFKSKLFQSGVVHYLNVIKQIALQKASTLLAELPLPQHQIELLKSHLIINQSENKRRD